MPEEPRPQPVKISGVWYPAGSSRRVAATLHGQGDRYRIVIAGNLEQEGLLENATVSRRVGNIPRSITFDDQSLFETADNPGMDAWLGQTSSTSGSGLLHHMETRWSWIAISLVAVVLLFYAGGRWGLPWASEKIARVMPERLIEYVSDGSLELLDQLFLKPSELEKSEQERIRNRVVRDYGNRYQVLFRQLGLPNAFALPNGDIVVTDAFVQLATEEEFDAVLLHEIGHIVERHGMQQLVRTSIVTFVVAMIIGDPSGLEEVVVGLPVFLMQSHYSRNHESSADEYAFREMMANGIDPIHFATIMEKMARFASQADGDRAGDQPDADSPLQDDEAEAGSIDSADGPVPYYLSSHPATGERIQRARELSELFNDANAD